MSQPPATNNNVAEAVKERMLRHDSFSQLLGLEVDEVAPGYCRLHFIVRPDMVNGFGALHGGVMFSAADSAFAFACNSHGRQSVGLTVTIDYLEAGRAGDVLTVEFTVAGIACLGLNGGPAFRHTEAFSFQIATDDQDETDRYWNAIVGNGGEESACGWCRDRWGISWQITPRVLTDALAIGGAEAKRAFEAMMGMRKIDVAAIEAARRG